MNEKYGLRDMLDAGRDPLAEATGGLLHWNDLGMDTPETGWEEFPPNQRVEVLTGEKWHLGTVRVCDSGEGGGIEIECDEPFHDNEKFYGGRGALVPIRGNTKRGIWSVLRIVKMPLEDSTEREL